MSIIGNAVTVGGGSGGDPVLLWTNPNPYKTSGFSRQTLYLGADYPAYLIECKRHYGTNAMGEGKSITYLPAGTVKGVVQAAGGEQQSYAETTARYVTISATGDFAFTTGFRGDGTTDGYDKDFWCIPTRIWGIQQVV